MADQPPWLLTVRMGRSNEAGNATTPGDTTAGDPNKVANGLALCVMHHKLFDLGIMTVDEDMNIHV